MKHVILGAGPAGVIAAETLRKHRAADEIVVIGDEPEAPYSRMAIPYLLIGKVAEAGTQLRHTPGHFAALRITVKQGRATQVDVANRCVRLEDGSREPFDKLLIAEYVTVKQQIVNELQQQYQSLGHSLPFCSLQLDMTTTNNVAFCTLSVSFVKEAADSSFTMQKVNLVTRSFPHEHTAAQVQSW
ncbi:MAG: NAD(P)/FAD-dependent oxidoreductase, partial [Microbacteriaceae bacterium]|nr:NAD(P)/FAD-dependent oxidoreductase [Burkholderiaceae bacterium]